jgi:hypothetical protein
LQGFMRPTTRQRNKGFEGVAGFLRQHEVVIFAGVIPAPCADCSLWKLGVVGNARGHDDLVPASCQPSGNRPITVVC